MIQVQPDCEANALRMLRKNGKYLGAFSGTSWYLLDGRVWAVRLEELTIFRCDNKEEVDDILKAVKYLENPGTARFPLTQV